MPNVSDCRALRGLLLCALAPWFAHAAEEAVAGYPQAQASSASITSGVLPQRERFTPEELEALVAPYALYPDDLLAIVLAASAYPQQIVEANRFMATLPSASVEPPMTWDDSVVALLNYPDALALLADDLEGTHALGLALVHQRNNVLAAAARFRGRAYRAGNLRSDAYQQVTLDDDLITVEPADDTTLYVPDYDPARVVVRQRRAAFDYYPRPCPLYYYPYGVGYQFPSSHFFGVSRRFSIGWGPSNLFVHDPWHYAHPFYGYRYADVYYRAPVAFAPVVVVPLARRAAPAASWEPRLSADQDVRRATPPARVQRTRITEAPRRVSDRTERGVESFSIGREVDDTWLHALTSTSARTASAPSSPGREGTDRTAPSERTTSASRGRATSTATPRRADRRSSRTYRASEPTPGYRSASRTSSSPAASSRASSSRRSSPRPPSARPPPRSAPAASKQSTQRHKQRQ